jgi:hypothetical protein
VATFTSIDSSQAKNQMNNNIIMVVGASFFWVSLSWIAAPAELQTHVSWFSERLGIYL